MDLKALGRGSLIFSPPRIGENMFLVLEVNLDGRTGQYTFSGKWLSRRGPQTMFGPNLYFYEVDDHDAWTCQL